MSIISNLFERLRKKEISYIDSNKDLQEKLKNLSSENQLGIDTEFTWRNTYFPQLSLVQISSSKEIFLIDCLSITDLNGLLKIFRNEKISKIFHSARGDISVLNTSMGAKFKNIFDVQLAENILSPEKNAISYKNLVRRYFYKSISKEETNSDWTRRPLKKSQISYASEDVRYLIQIKNSQKKKLISKSLFQKFNIEMSKELSTAETDFGVLRYERYKKKKKNISKEEKDIFFWRENLAAEKNIPPSFIFKDSNLKRLKEVIFTKKFSECDWIIRDSNFRENFLSVFE
ncbi:MAG: hypothetical protein CL851_06715 [Crocinitomicaceae bacterium]|nr:hypothetical protein [Crocinitomicaceae bacterium]|tara:strand:- start:261 stop:1124 length:864 start_codon:yes stop_codon:yes gene_type:complete